jgi:hypothetical protein
MNTITLNLEALLGVPSPRPPKMCVLGRFIANLEDPYQAALLKRLNSTETTISLHRWLSKEVGLKLAQSTVYIHRKNTCGCANVAAAAATEVK